MESSGWWSVPAGIYLFKVNNRNHVVLVSLLLTLKRFHLLFWRFYCWLWKTNCLLGYHCWYWLLITTPCMNTDSKEKTRPVVVFYFINKWPRRNKFFVDIWILNISRRSLNKLFISRSLIGRMGKESEKVT